MRRTAWCFEKGWWLDRFAQGDHFSDQAYLFASNGVLIRCMVTMVVRCRNCMIFNVPVELIVSLPQGDDASVFSARNRVLARFRRNELRGREMACPVSFILKVALTALDTRHVACVAKRGNFEYWAGDSFAGGCLAMIEYFDEQGEPLGVTATAQSDMADPEEIRFLRSTRWLCVNLVSGRSFRSEP
jgi:hypothetical protein